MYSEVATTFSKEFQNDFKNYITGQYDFEIELFFWQKILILVLNIFTGGLGTLLLPFLNRKKKQISIICAAVLLAILQTFHFLHFFSLLSKVEFLEKIYNYISSDKFLESLFGNNKNEANEEGSMIELIIEGTKFNISKTISEKSRKEILKKFFGIISGMSYANSIFTTIVNFLDAGVEKNKLLAYKIVLYSIFNPGAGILLASFAMIPSCIEEDIKGIVLSILSIIIGLVIILCPVSLSIGVFLVRLTNKMITLFPLKITLIYIGLIGILISILTSGINKRKILEVKELIIERPLKPFDILYKCGESLEHLTSTFGFKSFFRLIANIVIPGSGTISLLCKYGFNFSIIRTAIMQFILGDLLFLSAILMNFHYKALYEFFFSAFFFIGDEIIYSNVFLNFAYTIGLNFYISGIILIIITDYIPDAENRKNGISGVAGLVLNILTGGLGITLFGDFFCRIFYRGSRDKMWWGIVFQFLILECSGFVCFGGVLFCLFYPENANKACKIAFPICYCLISIICGSQVMIKDEY